MELYTLTPIELVHAVLPELIERGSGAIVVGHGSSAVHPMPGMSGPGPVMSATRNYLYSLNGELAGTGVFVGTLAIGAMVARSPPRAVGSGGAGHGGDGFCRVEGPEDAGVVGGA